MNKRPTARIRGVNLGGWLVLEKWMTPSLFAGTDANDEHSFMQTKDAKRKITNHRDSFITEPDFAWIKQQGLNAVRLPIGYWILGGDDDYLGGIEYVDWAFRMAEKYGLLVLLDLHAAPGSQNGFDHSGRIGEADWFTSPEARRQTIDSLHTLYQRYKTSPSLWGVQLLNEPTPHASRKVLRQYYRQAADIIDDGHKIIFHDAFRPRRLNGALGGNQQSMIDTHIYHMISPVARLLSARQFVRICQPLFKNRLQALSAKQPVLVGEWSAVISGQKLAKYNQSDAVSLQVDFANKQLAVYDSYAHGWFYWSYKTERKGMWNFRYLIENGLLEI